VTVTPNLSPVVNLGSSVTSGYAPTAVQFSSSGTYDPEGGSLNYVWNFGNGATSTAANPAYTYTAAGTYTATLTVTDPVGNVTTRSRTITIAPNRVPVAVIGASTTSAYAPITVRFNSTGSYDPDGGTLRYAWAFGDGATSTAANPSYTYTIPGTYTATLRVTDPYGLSAAKSLSITVRKPVMATANVSAVKVNGVRASRATVTVTDTLGRRVPGATVTGTWSGVVSATVTAKTDAYGRIVVTSPTASKSGSIRYTVTNVVMPNGWAWDGVKRYRTIWV
jgi:PKD repeat protein